MTNGRLAHTATKGAVVAMTRQLAARGLRMDCALTLSAPE